ncbi:hypothetical protein FVE85_2537 [Porphyridium purpureum]|uniref:Uncharacterized protein n=1 Tax=Porphyridium purpureum TaxID=35688 RepID=A0A5J4YKN1_PORPP|nr:hypothetical protein FVE85_2537 [Porphyridium purpureum]|eukprot:POR1085..scf291_13
MSMVDQHAAEPALNQSGEPQTFAVRHDLSAKQTVTPVRKRASLSKNVTPLKTVQAQHMIHSLMKPTISSQNKTLNKENAPDHENLEHARAGVAVTPSSTKYKASPAPSAAKSPGMPVHARAGSRHTSSATAANAPCAPSESSVSKSSNQAKSPLENLKGLNQRMRAEIVRSESEMAAHLEALSKEIALKDEEKRELEASFASELQSLAEERTALAAALETNQEGRRADEQDFIERHRAMNLKITTLEGVIADLEKCKEELLDTVANVELQKLALHEALEHEKERMQQASTEQDALKLELGQLRQERESLEVAHGVVVETMNEQLQALDVQLHGIEQREVEARQLIAELQQRLTESAVALHEKQLLCAQKDEIVSKLHSTQDALRLEVVATHEQLASLEVLLREQRERSEALERNVQEKAVEWSEKHAELRGAKEEVEHQVRKVTEEADILSTGIVEMREQLADTIADKIELESALEVVRGEKRELAGLLEEAHASKTRLRNLNADILKRLNEAVGKCALQEDTIQGLVEEVDGVLRRHATLSAERAAVSESLDVCRAEQDRTRAELDALASAHASLQGAHSDLHSQLKQSHTQLELIKKELEQTSAEKASLHTQLQESKRRNDELSAHIQEAREQAKAQQCENADERDTLMRTIELQEETIHAARARMGELVHDTNELEQERQTHLDAIEILRSETELRDLELARMSEENLALSANLQTVKKECESSKVELAGANERIRRLEREKSTAQALLQQSHKILTMLQAGLSAQQQCGKLKAANEEQYVQGSGGTESSAASVWMQRAAALARLDGGMGCVRSVPTRAAAQNSSTISESSNSNRDNDTTSSFQTAPEN